jgi:ATP-dependent DNA helicase PIF1
MESLSGETMIFQSLDGGTLQDKEQREKQLSNFMAPRELKLKINSQVMLIKNMDDSLVNGSIGKVVRFADVEAESDLILDKNEMKKLGKEPPKKPSGKIYPVVEFLQPGGYKRTVMILPESWKVELPSGEVQVSRTQVSTNLLRCQELTDSAQLPLILSWAMSIHKSQGQTLERVKVDLSRIFEKGL